MPAAEFGADVHRLIVNPTNTSLVLGVADYATHRPARFLARKLTGNPDLHFPDILSPAKWGEWAGRVGEHADFSLGKLTKGIRKEDLKLTPEHLARIHTTLEGYKTSANAESVAYGKKLHASLDNVIRTHSHNTVGLDDVLHAHLANPDRETGFAHTLHGVHVPSAMGEVGKHIKNFSTDAATFVGTGHIMHQLQQAQGRANSSPEGAQKMVPDTSKIAEALDSLDKVAAMLAEIPKRDAAYKRASDLHAQGAISADEIDKYASVFYVSPEASDVLAQTVQRFAPEHAKSARLGEVVVDAPATAGTHSSEKSGNGFDNFCLSAGPR